MSFEERLAYLSSVAPDTPAPKEEDSSLFGIDASMPKTQFWSPEFLKLCLEDLKEMQYPPRKQVFQTLAASQIAFIVVIVCVLLLDAFSESFVRTLIQGKPFSISVDMILKRPPT